jgi:hypothetical protein
MIRGGDAVEVKTHRGIGQIQLNSSPPKRKLKATDPRIQGGCKNSEVWNEKDFLYFIGKTNDEYVEALWLIDGRCMADEEKTYDLIFDKISLTVSDLGGEPGNEIGRLNDVDNLKATSLRVRAMWLLEHPANLFEAIFTPTKSNSFVLNVLISLDKWNTYNTKEKNAVYELRGHDLEINQIQIPDSGKSDQLLQAVHISWQVKVD